MANIGNFDANDVDPSIPFTPLPAGQYVAAIVESESVIPKSGVGKQLVLVFVIIDGEHKDRKLYVRLNLEHTKAETVKYARADLSAICRAVGIMQPKDSADLHNIPMVITVKCKKRPDTGDIQNDVRGFARKEAGVPLKATASPAANSNAAPWQR